MEERVVLVVWMVDCVVVLEVFVRVVAVVDIRVDVIYAVGDDDETEFPTVFYVRV